MSITKQLLGVLIFSLLMAGCAGNYKSSDDRYRPVGQPPVVIDNNTSK